MKLPPRYITSGQQVSEQKGPNGRNLCRQCGKEVSPPRRTFCSPHCVHEWGVRSSGSYARKNVFERDRGVCKQCGLDTEQLKGLLLRVKMERGAMAYRELVNRYRVKYGFGFELEKHFWEADHIVSVADGGGSCTLENLTTLCIPCHRKKTRSWWGKKKRKSRGIFTG